MQQGYFITGTDTNVGKTWSTVALMRYFKRQGKSVVGMKPVASGCFMEKGSLRNLDALLIQENASVPVTYDVINPYAYLLPVSPHIAGVDNPVDLAVVSATFKQLSTLADIVLVEGVGGWYAPINNQHDVSDMAQTLGLPVILVVAIKLGCINHARLTFQAIGQSGLACAGWIGVCTEPQLLCLDNNIHTLSAVLNTPLLGILPYMNAMDFDVLSRQINL
ncbi:dethiobiotin synthase [Crenothrix polyspora]|uniref:ATP-dependent dethiobiotin synthetase BioD n=1 Tax=Crenothrix polyspora TaxID=360316 RepID=A0A1R4H5H1_9GAMM|nr:dethiobiotin synthase [Crenothrix polyspora]SJM91416.1 dethiobiotin synthetase [Crenothrix polyspora]